MPLFITKIRIGEVFSEHDIIHIKNFVCKEFHDYESYYLTNDKWHFVST
jgi:hypothetical protein